MAATFSEEVRKFAWNLVKNSGIITCTDELRIDKPRSGASSNVTKDNECDRFRLLIPYGGATLKWEIVFNSNEPHFPPDVIFGDNDIDFEPNLEKMPSLQYWNPDDPKSLTAVVKELLEQYKEYQHELVKSFSQKVQSEFESVQQLDTFARMEVYVHRGTQNSEQQANFLLKLPIDLQRLPAYLVNQNLGEDFITLFVSYQSYEGLDDCLVSPKVFLSPRVEQAFANMTGIKCPGWADCDESLISYIMAVHCYFQEKIEQIIEGFERRKNYIAAFLSAYGTCVIEYDVETFSVISFLMQHQNFFFILTIEIGQNFPEEQPAFVMKSIYHCFSDDPYYAVDDSYPYSPRWSPDEMASRAKSYLCNAIPKFKAASMKNRPYHPPAIALEM